MAAELQDLVLLPDGKVGVVFDQAGGGYVIRGLPGNGPVNPHYDPNAPSVDARDYTAVLNYFAYLYREEWQGPAVNTASRVRADYLSAPLKQKDQFQRWLNSDGHLDGPLPEWGSLMELFAEYMERRKFNLPQRRIYYYLLFRKRLT